MDYDIIVVGGGHAGIEAALACSRLGFRTLMVTQNPDRIGWMSCNPAIGGLSKGNLVREVDALGGEMGLLIDRTMIQYRTLNASRGPAVQAPRAQADRFAYAREARKSIETQGGLSVFMDTVTDLMVDATSRSCSGVVTERGNRITSRAVVLTTGTFMEGTVYIGEFTASSGRLGEGAAVGLGTSLRRLGFDVGRMKTGTPARIFRGSIDFSEIEEQLGDSPQLPFSFMNESVIRPSVPCHITYTNDATHEVIRRNMHRSPLYSGKIVGKGPRYCPSIEDKVVKFPERERHQIFVEPESLETEEVYLNGLSSSLPEDVQVEFIRTMRGFSRASVARPGYAVEYDYVNPLELHPSLEAKRCPNLFLAGQTNGTSGYEEAAAQGLLAGINASLKLRGEPPLVLARSEAYAGVLIDDLITQGTKEPYRMFTSRAEFRLNLRHDTSDSRLTPRGMAAGLVTQERAERFERKRDGIAAIKELLFATRLSREAAGTDDTLLKHVGRPLAKALTDPLSNRDYVMSLCSGAERYPPAWRSEALLDVRYEGYVAKQGRMVERFGKMEDKAIPTDFDYDGCLGFSTEAREKLKVVLPRTLGQAARITGVRRSDIAILMIELAK